MGRNKTKAATEYGDFQTPQPLADEAVALLVRLGFRPRSILEPTCGHGAFVRAAAVFSSAKLIVGLDINAAYLRSAAVHNIVGARVDLRRADFFTTDWNSILGRKNDPWLILGNPPWVTSAVLGAIESGNLPKKTNFQKRTGIEAITGKSNFDISEWMLLRYLDWLKDRDGAFAVLCKTAVARKILVHAWKYGPSLKSARIYKIDALRQFGAAVDACFFVVETTKGSAAFSCDVFNSLDSKEATCTVGFRDGYYISDLVAFDRARLLMGPEAKYVWRSGIKHDCSKVMELTPRNNRYINGLKEVVSLENRYLYPMLKGSDVGNERTRCRFMMLVTQQRAGEATQYIAKVAPDTWKYLRDHTQYFARRSSTVYHNKPPYSIFGVGPYTFAPWKIAISGFYKRLSFLKVGPVDDKPVVFDDTVNFLPCSSEQEAEFLYELLTSEEAADFYGSMINWDEKRPITIDLLRRLNIEKLAVKLGRHEEYSRYTSSRQMSLVLTQNVA